MQAVTCSLLERFRQENIGGHDAGHRDRPHARREACALPDEAKQTLNLNLRRRLVQDVPFGMALEGLTAADLAYQNGAG